jgi:hypothetical protein
MTISIQICVDYFIGVLYTHLPLTTLTLKAFQESDINILYIYVYKMKK